MSATCSFCLQLTIDFRQTVHIHLDPNYKKICIYIYTGKINKDYFLLLLQYLQKATESYLTFGDGPVVVYILKEMTSE